MKRGINQSIEALTNVGQFNTVEAYWRNQNVRLNQGLKTFKHGSNRPTTVGERVSLPRPVTVDYNDNCGEIIGHALKQKVKRNIPKHDQAQYKLSFKNEKISHRKKSMLRDDSDDFSLLQERGLAKNDITSWDGVNIDDDDVVLKPKLTQNYKVSQKADEQR